MSRLLENKRIKAELRQIFLDKGYIAGFNQNVEFSNSEIPGFTEEHHKMLEHEFFHNQNLEFWSIIEVIVFNPAQRTKIIFKLADKGFFEKEQDFTAPFSNKFIRILEYIDSLEDNLIKSDVMFNQLVTLFPHLDIKEIINRMENTLNNNIQDIITQRYNKLDLILPSECISEYGNDLLQRYYLSLEIFNSTPNKQELLKEHHLVYKLKQMGEFKDTIVKMGSIIEYVVTEWLKRNSHTNPPKFEKKLNKLEHLSRSSLTGSITPTDWRITNSSIRDYRNFIHLDKLFRDRISLTLREFEQLEPVYLKILHELS